MWAMPSLVQGSGTRAQIAEKTSARPEALKALEVTEVAGVQIVGAELSTPEQRIRVEVQFADLAQLLRYLGELNLGEPTRRCTLEQTTAPNAPGSPSTAFLLGSLSKLLPPHFGQAYRRRTLGGLPQLQCDANP
jgi:hypothetical protein